MSVNLNIIVALILLIFYCICEYHAELLLLSSKVCNLHKIMEPVEDSKASLQLYDKVPQPKKATAQQWVMTAVVYYCNLVLVRFALTFNYNFVFGLK